MRLGEARAGRQPVPRTLRHPLVHVNAEDRFLGGLAGLARPGKEAQVHRQTFIAVFEEEARKIGGAISWRRARFIPT